MILHPLTQSCLFLPPHRHRLANITTRKTLDRGDFRLLHYAGEVTYCVVGKGETVTHSIQRDTYCAVGRRDRQTQHTEGYLLFVGGSNRQTQHIERYRLYSG